MKISLILATRNRVVDLERFLDHLSLQSHRDYDLIIIDQSDPLIQESNARAIASRNELRSVRHVRTDTRGLSRARNIGMAFILGDILAFPDDDCWYPPDLLERVSTFFETKPDCGLLSGMYTEPGLANPNFHNSAGELHGLHGAQSVSSVTMFVQVRQVRHDLLRFDESLGAGTETPIGEETDFAFSLLKSGIKAHYQPSMIIYHKINREIIDEARSLAAERAYGYVMGKHVDHPSVLFRYIGGLAKIIVLGGPSRIVARRLLHRTAGFFAGLKKRPIRAGRAQ